MAMPTRAAFMLFLMVLVACANPSDVSGDDGADAGVETVEDVFVDVPVEPPVDVVADVPVEPPVDVVADVPGELPEDVVVDVALNPSVDVLADVPVEPPKDVPVDVGSFVPNGYILTWEDNFDGPTIDTNNWVVASLRDPVSGDLVPGAAGDHLLNNHYAGYITQEDTFIEDGALILRNQKRAYEGTNPPGMFAYTSGWVMSMHRVHFNKGYLEFRAQFPTGDKVWPALWLISEQLVWCPEWDMWEYFGFRDDLDSPYDNMGTHLCYGGWPKQKWKSNFISQFDGQHDCEAWHTYGFEWTSTTARWFLDGQLVHELSAESLGAHQHLWPNEEMYIVINNGQRSKSPDQATVWPNRLTVDYVRLYQPVKDD